MGMMIHRNKKKRAEKQSAPYDNSVQHERAKEPESTSIEANEESYTKTDIHRMPVSDLRELASKHGIENPESMSGSELKEYLISKMGL